MEIGIRFEIEGKWDFYLNKILNCIPTEKYTWRITNEEMITEESMCAGGTSLSLNGIYHGNEVEEILPQKPYYVLFIQYNGFLNDTANAEEIKALQNHGDIAIYLVDVYYVELYCRDQKELETIIEKVKETITDQIERITTETCNRVYWDRL